MKWLLLVSVISLALFRGNSQSLTSSCTDQNHIFLVPGVLTAGGNSRACVSRFTDAPARLTLVLKTNDDEKVTAGRQLHSGDGGCLDIPVPLKPNTRAELVVNIRYLEENCTWYRSIPLRIGSGKLVVVHTERARYRPGDMMRFRISALKADLTPAHNIIDEVWLEGPRGAWEGVKVTQWLRVRTRLGVAQLQYQLDEMAPVGKWTVRVRLADGSQGSSIFTVGNYELPPFQLTVRHSPRILRSSERLVWTVCVRYPWSEAVEGMLVIRIRGAGVGAGAGGIRTAVRLRAPRACHRHAAASRRVGLNSDTAPEIIIADFSFQEEGTRSWQNTTVVSQVVDSPITLEFLTKHRTIVSSGLPYKLKIRATRWDQKPSVGEKIHVCKSPSKLNDVAKNMTCVDSETDEKGIARVMFTANESPFYTFQASTNTTSASLELQVKAGKGGKAALGPLRVDSTSKTLVPLYLSINDVTKPITVHFVVITRGGIIHRWGATTQCPTNSNQILTAQKDTKCPNFRPNTKNYANFVANFEADDKIHENAIEHDVPNVIIKENLITNVGSNSSVLDALLDAQMWRIMLPVKVTHQMCPDSHLVTYFYHNNELISASKHFEMEECFANKVTASWLQRQTPPGSFATIQLSTPGPALCALSVLDTASKWGQQGANIKDLIMKDLRKLIDGHRNLTEYDAAGECFLTSDNLEDTRSNHLFESWLASAGLRLLGGGVAMTDSRGRNCDSPPLPLVTEETPRSDFSESWLWRLVAVGANGSVAATARTPDSITRFEANAFCVSKTGVAISQPSMLQVFREFFIHADGPRRLRRGDSTVVRYRLFNYLYEPLSVKVEILTDPHLEGPNNYIEKACIHARSSIARRVKILAKLPGVARLSIKATTVADRCGNNTKTSRKTISDEVIVEAQVDPEGVPIQEHKSILLCDKGHFTSAKSAVKWGWSEADVVPGTESVTLWAASDFTGPLLADADNLVSIPRGCGEQNMARLSTNLLALGYLHPQTPQAAAAKDHVARGFTRQLQYTHTSGGFSAFGSTDPEASTWLTAFCVRYLRRAHQVITPDTPIPPAIERAESWLLSQQMENGCFRNEGNAFHKELKGGLNDDGETASIALTAYVITSLIESSRPIPFRTIQNSLSCLRALSPKKIPSKTYAYSIITYAFMRLRRYEKDLRMTNEALSLDGVASGLGIDEEMRGLLGFLKIAKRSGDYIWWESGSLATSIESTGYALLALSECPQQLLDSCTSDARRAMLWLATHRSAAGGFVSTQDTLVALEGLARWSSILPSNTSLTLKAKCGIISRSANISSDNKVPDVLKMPVGNLSVTVHGSGCALVQATRFYNTLSSNANTDKVLQVQVNVQTDGTYNCDSNTTCFCAAVLEVCAVWSGDFPEMALLEVTLPGGYGADVALLYSQLQSTDILLRRIEISATNTRTTFYLGSRDGDTSRGGHNCYKIHAVGPAARTKPAYAKIMDYYRPDVNHVQMYSIPENCPPRITHDATPYTISDNIFNKAKSLDGEILISHEYSFEDFPEIVPLEDPLYDNLVLQTHDKNSDFLNQNESNEEITDQEDTNMVKQGDRAPNNNENNNNNNIDTQPTQSTMKKCEKMPYDKENKEMEHTDSINTHLINNISNFTNGKVRSHVDSENNINKDIGYVNKVNKEVERSIENKRKDTNSYTIINNENEYIDRNIDLNRHFKVLQDTQNKFNKISHMDLIDDKISQDRVAGDRFNNFHITDSDKDLEFPTGIEGPVPSIVLPPPNFVYTPRSDESLVEDKIPSQMYPSLNPYEINHYYNHEHFKRNL